DAPEAGDVLSITSPQTFGAAGGDMCSFAIPGDMPGDTRLEAGGALCFRGPVLVEPLDLLGQPEISLTLTADKPQAFVAALLVDEAPDGSQNLIARGFCNLTHRHGDSDPTPVQPGEEMQVRVPLHGIGYRVKAGHRLGVQLASSYWPILWPAPEPVSLHMVPGQSTLHLPLRAARADEPVPRALPDPPSAKVKPPLTRVREGSMERSFTTDLTTGLTTHRVFIDGGVFGPVGDMRLDDIGTVLRDISDRRYIIHPGDPSTARAIMEQNAGFSRDDWSVKIETYAEQTATASAFHLTARIKCWDGDTVFFEADDHFEIPRNGM
ncbi:MAG: CocE/NonD family hydrolase C-terminal non-catalytic domain-containing protein, partial [Pseudomonadota bacterium]